MELNWRPGIFICKRNARLENGAEDVNICLRINMLLNFPSIDSRAKQSKGYAQKSKDGLSHQGFLQLTLGHCLVPNAHDTVRNEVDLLCSSNVFQ